MKKLAIALLLALLVTSAASAHGGLEHVMGTVTAITDHSISVKTSDGTIKIVIFDATAHFLKGTAAATAKDVTVGSRVAIHAKKNGDNLLAVEVKIGVAQPKTTALAPQKKPRSGERLQPTA